LVINEILLLETFEDWDAIPIGYWHLAYDKQT